MPQWFSKNDAQREAAPPAATTTPAAVSKQVGLKLGISLFVEGVKRIIVELGFPWF